MLLRASGKDRVFVVHRKRLLQYFYTLHLLHNVTDPFTGTTRRVKNVSLGGGEKHLTDKRGATERALETTLAPFGVVKALQSDTSGCDLVFESISGVVTL